MVLTTLMLIPLVGSIVVALLPGARETLAKQIALGVSLVALGYGAVNLLSVGASGGIELVEQTDWISAFGVSWALGVDGIAALLVLMALVLVPVVIVAGWWDAENCGTGASVKGFFALILSLEVFMIGVFAATDVFLFYVLFEAMLIPVYFLIGRYGGANRAKAATKFLLYSLLGGLFMLASVVGLWAKSAQVLGAGTFDFAKLAGLGLDATTQKWLFLGFFFAFAVKAPMVPLQTWLPDAAEQSTPGTATLLVGVLDKVGTFGMIRYCLELFPAASKEFAPVIVVLALISVFYGAFMALAQKDMMRLVAYTSVSHFGFIVLGIFVFTQQGMTGSAFYMVNHGFSTGAMFLVVGFLIARRGSRNIADFGGVVKVAPLMAGIFLLSGLSSLALPGMSSFVSEFLVLTGTFVAYPIYGAIATTGIILAALYILWLYQRTMTGEPGAEVSATVGEISVRELVAIAPLIALIVALGVMPNLALNSINPTANQVLTVIEGSQP